MTASRSSSRPRPISDYLSRATTLGCLMERDHQQRTLLERVRSLLPQPLAPHCLAVVQSAEKMVLYTDSSAWASRFRFLTRELLQQMRALGLECRQIKVRILPQNQPKRPARRTARRLSKENARLLLEVADGISDPLLSASLRRLGRHHQE